jgi:hypothetical protein
MKMQYELLSDRFADDPNANLLAASLLKGMADGSRAHHVAALKFGLREGFSRMNPTTAEPATPTLHCDPRPVTKKPRVSGFR